METKKETWAIATAIFLMLPNLVLASGVEAQTGTTIASNSAIELAIRLSADYLERACRPNGKFVYQIDSRTGQVSTNYNIIRHAGAMYSLAMFNEAHPNQRTIDTMIKAGQFMRRYEGPLPGPTETQGMLAVWSKPPQTTFAPQAELGGTALGLAALVELQKVAPKSVSNQELKALARFAVSLQKDDGSFYTEYDSVTGADNDLESLYYPGEAVLGLTTMYERGRSPEWLIPAAKGLAFLARSRTGTQNPPVDHWALISTAKLMPHYDASHCPASREELLRHAIQICKVILAEQIIDASKPELVGGFDIGGRTTPTAIRLEGLLAALEFIPSEDTDLHSKIVIAVRRGVNFLLRAQIKSGPYAGGIPEAVRIVSSQSDKAAASDLRPDNIRIDFVQHALSAWIRYQKLFRGN